MLDNSGRFSIPVSPVRRRHGPADGAEHAALPPQNTDYTYAHARYPTLVPCTPPCSKPRTARCSSRCTTSSSTWRRGWGAGRRRASGSWAAGSCRCSPPPPSSRPASPPTPRRWAGSHGGAACTCVVDGAGVVVVYGSGGLGAWGQGPVRVWGPGRSAGRSGGIVLLRAPFNVRATSQRAWPGSSLQGFPRQHRVQSPVAVVTHVHCPARTLPPPRWSGRGCSSAWTAGARWCTAARRRWCA